MSELKEHLKKCLDVIEEIRDSVWNMLGKRRSQ